MKKQLFMIGMLMITGITFAQTDRLWSPASLEKTAEVIENKRGINNPNIFSLDINRLKNILSNAPKRLAEKQNSEIIISFPNSEGNMENFKVTENSNLAPELAVKYPDIKSYIGQSIEDPSSTIFFSLSQLGLSSMEIYGNKSAVFIEPYTKDLSRYVVYKKSDTKENLTNFECKVVDEALKATSNNAEKTNANDAKLRTYRMALSCTGEYTAYFGGTKANALAAMNNTMTRVNGIFEKDMSLRMVLIANNDNLIYTHASADPYSPSTLKSRWNLELQNNLTNTIGNSAYDIGHLFGAAGGGGDSGCIGCVCRNDTASTTDLNKGSAFTSPINAIPSGNPFDIIAAHEIGHQFGANHTYSMTNDGSNLRVEPGSGSTIMSYAGLTAYDVQPYSDNFFHASNIQQVTNYIKSTTCAAITNTGNAIPTANAGLDYIIPKGTPFMLTGTGTDANGDSLYYIWEQNDSAPSSQTGSMSAAYATKTIGPTFRSWTPITSPIRYFPKMTSILAGASTTQGSKITVEALSNVARSLNFRFTVRDNKAGGSGNNSDDSVITVTEAAGPFYVTSQNSDITYAVENSKIVTWDVAKTTANGINTANVDILWSTDNGSTWTTLLAATPNDGSQAVTIPGSPPTPPTATPTTPITPPPTTTPPIITTTTGRIMVKGTNHIFFDINNANITTKEYCKVSASNTTNERIGNVKFGTINNTSTGTTGYEKFTLVSTDVTPGSTHTISITPTWTSTAYSEAYAVYIDYNGDGDFEDSGEFAWSKTASTTTPATGNIIIPATATLGSTIMRVMMQPNALPASACDSYAQGQIEDYTLKIVALDPPVSSIKKISGTNNRITDINLYPNPVKDVLNISNTTSEEYKIFDMGGKVISSGKLERGSVNVSQLIKGAYVIQIGETTKRFIKD